MKPFLIVVRWFAYATDLARSEPVDVDKLGKVNRVNCMLSFPLKGAARKASLGLGHHAALALTRPGRSVSFRW